MTSDTCCTSSPRAHTSVVMSTRAEPDLCICAYACACVYVCVCACARACASLRYVFLLLSVTGGCSIIESMRGST